MYKENVKVIPAQLKTSFCFKKPVIAKYVFPDFAFEK